MARGVLRLRLAAAICGGGAATAALLVVGGCYQRVVHTEGIGAQASEQRIDERSETDGPVERLLFGEEEFDR